MGDAAGPEEPSGEALRGAVSWGVPRSGPARGGRGVAGRVLQILRPPADGGNPPRRGERGHLPAAALPGLPLLERTCCCCPLFHSPPRFSVSAPSGSLLGNLGYFCGRYCDFRPALRGPPAGAAAASCRSRLPVSWERFVREPDLDLAMTVGAISVYGEA